MILMMVTIVLFPVTREHWDCPVCIMLE